MTCLKCACEEMSAALSQIDSFVDLEPANDGGPNSVATYDLDCDPAGVVARVKSRVETLTSCPDVVTLARRNQVLEMRAIGAERALADMTEANAKNNDELQMMNARCTALEQRMKEAEGLVTPLLEKIERLKKTIRE